MLVCNLPLELFIYKNTYQYWRLFGSCILYSLKLTIPPQLTVLMHAIFQNWPTPRHLSHYAVFVFPFIEVVDQGLFHPFHPFHFLSPINNFQVLSSMVRIVVVIPFCEEPKIEVGRKKIQGSLHRVERIMLRLETYLRGLSLSQNSEYFPSVWSPKPRYIYPPNFDYYTSF